MEVPVELTVHSFLAFLEYLYINSATKYHWNPEILSHRLISKYLRSISINSRFAPTPRGIFNLNTLTLISQACDILDDSLLFRAIFLLAFFAFLRMSNIAPHSRFKFDASRHLLRQDIIFAHPGAHILIKWTKTLQDRSAHHFVQIPVLKNLSLCPVLALKKLLESRSLHLLHPSFFIPTLHFTQS